MIAYGRTILGVPDPDGWVMEGDGLPPLRIRLGSAPEASRVRLSPARALALPQPDLVVVEGEEPTDSGFVHPLLGACAAFALRFSGGDAFHGGGYVSPSGVAWAVLGLNRVGKSTLMASLADSVPVLTDDRLLVEDGAALAGPRCVDLREPVPGAVAVRWGERWRVRLGPCPVSAPLAGFVVLEWGSGPPALEPVRERAQRAAVLRGHRCFWAAVPAPVDEPLAALPMYRLVRPRDGESYASLLPS